MKDKTVQSDDAGASLPATDSRPLILIVDDLPEMRFFKRFYLEDCGYRILEAENGRQGVEAAIREQPRLIVMNNLMPEMNGLEATEIIRRLARLKYSFALRG